MKFKFICFKNNRIKYIDYNNYTEEIRIRNLYLDVLHNRTKVKKINMIKHKTKLLIKI